MDGDGDYVDDWNVLYDGKEGLFLIASKCIDVSKYNTNKFTSHGYIAYGYSEEYPKFVSPWDTTVKGTGTDYIPSLERLSEFPGNEMLLEEWSNLSDEDKKKWPSCDMLWKFNGCGPGMLDYNMWTDFIAPEVGELCIGSPTYELIQLSMEYSGKERVSMSPWQFNFPWGWSDIATYDAPQAGRVNDTPLAPQSEPFILPYGFDAINSGCLFSALDGYVVNSIRWIHRRAEIGGLRPCVKIKSGIKYNPNNRSMTAEEKQ